MEINNVFSPVPFYKNKKYWHSNKWYTYGQKCPIMMTSQSTLPFQLVVDSGVTLSSFTIKKADSDTVVRTVSTSGNYASIPGESYNVIQVKACAISALPYGNYYYALTLSDGSTYISDIIAIISDMSKCIKITYKNVENLYFSSGHIDFSNDFVFELYLHTTIGKPEYEYEEELTKRLGYKFLESQVVNKVYKFTFPATEQMCDAYRFVRMCDYIRIDTYNPDLSEYDHYNVIYLSSEVDWLDNGDIASIETSFETDSIVQKLQDYSRTQLVNFYNALLSNSDEVLKFDDETIAQYYSNYIQSIDGKMIRQLDEASAISDNTVVAIDENNGIGAAKKILLKPLITSVIGDELRASEVLQNFQAHISNGDIHITAQDRALLSLFAVDENGDVYLKDERGFYSNSFISAKGKSSGGSSGSASALYQLVDIEKNDTGDGVQGAEVGKVLMYNGTKWYAGIINTGLDEQALKTYLYNNKYTTTDYVDTKVSEVSTELNNFLQDALNNKVDTAFFARVFGLLDANGNEIAINDVTTVADSIKAKFGLWTEQYLSAKGKNDNTSGSASALYQLVDILSNATNDGVYGAEAGKVLMYNGSKWYAGTVDTGLDETALKTYLDTNKYTTTSYVDSKVLAVSTKLDNFLEGSDTDGIINKWKELEAFLAGQTQTSTLAELLAVKVDKLTKIVAGTGLSGGGDLSSSVTLSLASSGVTAGTYTKVTVDTYGRVITGTTLSPSDIPTIGISQVNGLQDALNNKVDTAFFARVFGLLDANGNEIAINDVTTVADSIKAKFGLWTEQYISALGKNSSSGGGSGASALYQLVDVVPNATNDGVLNATSGSVLMYNGSKWQAGSAVTDISTLTLQVNGSSLATFNGKANVTANISVPTKLSQLTNDSGFITGINSSMVTSALGYTPYNSSNPNGYITISSVPTKLSQLTDDVVSGKYLPLSGGTLTGGINLPTNYYKYNNKFGINCNNSDIIGANCIYFGDLCDSAGEGIQFYRSATTSDSLWANTGVLYFSPNTTPGSSNSTNYTILHSGNYNSYAPTLTGNGASGTWGINITGNASSATKLQTARTIWGQSFDGTGNVNGHLSVGYILGQVDSSRAELSLISITDNPCDLWLGSNSKAVWSINVRSTSENSRFSIYSKLGGHVFGITTDGNIGIGTGETSSISYKLHVNGTIYGSSTATFASTVTAPTFSGSLSGNASTATALTSSAGSSAVPIYFSSGKPVQCSTTLGVSITGNAATATNADMLDGVHYQNILERTYSGAASSGNSTGWFRIAEAKLYDSVGISFILFIQRAYNYTNNEAYAFAISISFAGGINITQLSGYANNSLITKIRVDWKSSSTAYVDLYIVRSTTNNQYSWSTVGCATSYTSWTVNPTLIGTAYEFTTVNGCKSDRGFTGALTGNASSATKLQTARTIWGQSFDGTADVNGHLSIGKIFTQQITNRAELSLVSSSNTPCDLWLGSNGELKWSITARDSSESYALSFYNTTGTGHVMRILTNGNVGIGTTSPTQKLHVVGNIAATGAITAKASSSDIRLKTDITAYKALSIIRKHRSIKYHWNEVAKSNADIFNDNDWHYGLIAQDLQKDLPQMVSDVFKDYLVINYERLIPICWKGLQEVDDEVTRLKKKVRKLEMEIRELKQKEDRV